MARPQIDRGERIGRVKMPRAPAPSAVGAIASSIAVLAAATLLTKSFALGKELVVAGAYGTDRGLEAYLVALVVCMFLVGLVAHSLPSAFIPVFVRHLENARPAAARALVGSTSAFALMAALACAGLVACLSGPLVDTVARGFDPAARALTRRLLLWLLPAVPLAGLASVWAAVMHARRRFWAVSLVPAVTPIAIVLAIALGPSPANVEVLAAATVLGLAGETMGLGVLVARAGLLAPMRLSWRDVGLREVLSEYAPVVAGAALLGLTPVIDRAVAATVGEGAVATLGYAGRLVDAGLALGATAIGTALLPHLARSVALGRTEELRRTFRGVVALVLFVSVPFTAVLAVSSHAIVGALFERGAFTAADTQAVAGVQAVLALQIPIYLVGIIAARMLAASRRNRVLLVGNVVSLALTVTLDLALVGPLGVGGIALATAITRTVVVSFLLVVCLRGVLADRSAAT
jgi:putative peptidoglycan lipid II flippase